MHETDEQIPSICFEIDDRLGSLYEDMKPDQDPTSLQDISVHDRYETREKIGSGGLKDIYLTYDHKSAREVALARPQDKKKRKAFLREAKMTALLEHPNIISVYDVDSSEKPFFTMKLVYGEDLSHHLFNEREKLSRNKLLRVFIKVCDALAYAHSRGIIHLDLKPGNIRINNFGEVLVYDWGESKRIFIPDNDTNTLQTDEIEISDVVVGTPAYMAPEQFSGNSGLYDQRTDIYSLGGILYSILTGKVPYTSESKPENRSLVEPIKRASGVPESLNAVVMKAMAENQDNRYQEVSELQKEIERYLDGFATEAEEAGFLKQLKLLLTRNKLISSLIAVALVIIISVVSIFISKLKQSESNTRAALVLAEKSKEETEKALETANTNFSMYKKEREEREEISSITSDSLSRANILPDKMSYNQAMQQLSTALKASPGNKQVYRKKVILHIFYEQFIKAAEEYEKAEKAAFLDDIMPIIKKYGELKKDHERLTEEQFVEVIREFSLQNSKWLSGAMIISRKQLMSGRSNHISLMKKIFERTNEDVDWKWNYKTEDGILFTYLSFAGLKNIYNYTALAGRYISVLDLSDMSKLYPQDLALAYVKKLIICGTKVSNIDKLIRVQGLEEIVIKKGQLTEDQLNSLDFVKITEID